MNDSFVRCYRLHIDYNDIFISDAVVAALFSLFHQFSEINRIIIGMKIKPVKQRAYGIYIDILSALKRCNERSDERAEEKSTNNFKLQYLMMHTIL